jgi:TatD DNase family protein
MNVEKLALLDAHVHLQDARFAGDLEEILDRARGAGVARWVCNGTREDDWARVLQLARLHSTIIPCLGLHPWYVPERSPHWLENLERLLNHSISGVGEIGLDLWTQPRNESEQELVFRQQIRLARQLKRPLMIHCVRAWDWLMRVLPEEIPEPFPLLIHAFGGPSSVIQPLAEMGAYFSFAGNIFQPRKLSQRAVLGLIPPDRLLLETDAPDLSPPREFLQSQSVALAADRNEPANLLAIHLGVAELLGLDPARLALQLWENGNRFLGGLLVPIKGETASPNSI